MTEQINFLNETKLQFMKEIEITIFQALKEQYLLRMPILDINTSLFLMKHRQDYVVKENFLA